MFLVKSLYKLLNFGGFKIDKALLWWQIPLPHKIKIFMWILTKKKLLTKVNLSSKGWTGSTKCHFCSGIESSTHLFLKCPFTQHVWFWMGLSQNYFRNWQTIQDIIDFSFSLEHHSQLAFLIVFSSVSWIIWKLRNDLCFQH